MVVGAEDFGVPPQKGRRTSRRSTATSNTSPRRQVTNLRLGVRRPLEVHAAHGARLAVNVWLICAMPSPEHRLELVERKEPLEKAALVADGLRWMTSGPQRRRRGCRSALIGRRRQLS